MGSPKQTTQKTTTSGSNTALTDSSQTSNRSVLGNIAGASGGTNTGFNQAASSGYGTSASGNVPYADAALQDYLRRAGALSQQDLVAGPSGLQQQAWNDAPGLYDQARGGMGVLQGLSSGQTQNENLNASIANQLRLGQGTYLNNLLGSSGGLTNSGAQEQASRLANEYTQDRLSNEYRNNLNMQLAATQAMPGYAGQLSGYLGGLGADQRAVQNQMMQSPLTSLGVLGGALGQGGAQFGRVAGNTAGQLNNSMLGSQNAAWNNQASNQNVTGSTNTSGRVMGTQDNTTIAPGPYKPSLFGQALGLAGTAAGAYFGGPAGGAAGSSIAELLSGLFSPTPKANPVGYIGPQNAPPRWNSGLYT